MTARVSVREIGDGKAAICRTILDDLPEWFGIPASKDMYVAEAAHLPMLACHDGEAPVGFVSIKAHTPSAAELFVLGVRRRYHRQGIGRALIDAAVVYGENEGLRVLTVKTLASTDPDPHYAATRRFYEAMGFLPIEIFPLLWGPENPCLMMMRVI